MRWTTKARIQRVCARVPVGPSIYRQIQRRFGTLGPDPSDRVPFHREMLAWLAEGGRSLEGATVVEIGTGHKPTLPVLFALCGAGSVTTVDLNPRLQWDLVAGGLRWMVDHSEDLLAQYDGLVERSVLEPRLEALAAQVDHPQKALHDLGVRVLAPADAARLPLADSSVDVHFSMTTLEHIDPEVLAAIIAESRRVLRPDGAFLHFIDPGDHFADQSDEITDIHFLRYSEEEWLRLAGNQFGYCNRLRASDHVALVRDGDFVVERVETKTDARSLAALEAGFPVNEAFANYEPEDLCAVSVRILARPERS